LEDLWADAEGLTDRGEWLVRIQGQDIQPDSMRFREMIFFAPKVGSPG
jgi:hypothetical protein